MTIYVAMAITAWWAVGVAIFLRTCMEIGPAIFVRDVVVACFAGVVGPLAVIWWLLYGRTMRRVMDRRLW